MMNKNKLMMIGLLICGSVHLMSMDAEIAGEALYNAVSRSNLTSVQAAINAGANVNWRNYNGRTALMSAVVDFYQRHEIVRALIVAGANVNLQDENGRTALMNATQYNSPEIVRVLIGADANVNLQDVNGRTALMDAAQCNSPEMVRVLIAADANVNLQDVNGRTALMNATIENLLDGINRTLLRVSMDPTIENRQYEIIRALIAAGRLGDLQGEQDQAILASVYDQLDAIVVKTQLEQEVFDGLSDHFNRSLLK